MHLLDELRGHFALMEGKTFHTLARPSPFRIVSAIPKEPWERATWLLRIELASGAPKGIYYSDMLRVYAWLADNGGKWRLLSDLGGTNLVRIGTGTESYLAPLLATLDEIEVRTDPPALRINYPEA